MKKMMITTTMLLSIFSFGASANGGNKLTDTSEAVATALVSFQSENSQATLDLFKGVKASPANGGVSVGVYLTDGTKVKFACHRHDAADPFECHETN